MFKIFLLNTSADVPRSLLVRAPGLLPAWRLLWWAAPGDVVVSPVPFDADFVKYAGRVLGERMDHVRILVAPEVFRDAELLSSPQFVRRLQDLCRPGAEYELVAATMTPSVARFAAAMGQVHIASSGLALEGPNELLNRKSYFRRLAAGIDAPLAEGRVVTNRDDLAPSIEELRTHTGIVIVKRDNAGGGFGNVVLSDSGTPLPGAHKAIRLESDVLDQTASRLWESLTDEYERSLVVEAYHVATSMFYFEFYIDSSGAVGFVNSGDIRLQETSDGAAWKWLGLQLPGTTPRASGRSALVEATKLATHLSAIGHRGYLNIDCVITDEGRIVVNEFNCRWGGGTVIHTLGTRLLGKQFGDTHFVRWVRDLPYTPLEQAVSGLEGAGLDPYAETDSGAIIVSIDPERKSASELVIRGTSIRELDELENRATAVLRSSSDAVLS